MCKKRQTRELDYLEGTLNIWIKKAFLTVYKVSYDQYWNTVAWYSTPCIKKTGS